MVQTTEESTIMTEDLSTFDVVGNIDVPDEVGTFPEPTQARILNQMSPPAPGNWRASNDFSGEMLAMTRTLFSSLETRVVRLEASSDMGDHVLRRKVALLQKKTLELHARSSESRNSVEGHITSVGEQLAARISSLEARMSGLEKAVEALESSRLDQMKMKLAKLETQIDAGVAVGTHKKSENRIVLAGCNDAIPAALVRWQTLEVKSFTKSKFPSDTPLVFFDHRGKVLSRSKPGKLRAVCQNSPDPETLIFSRDIHGGYVIHSRHDGQRLAVSDNGSLCFERTNSPKPSCRELFFVKKNGELLLIGSFKTQSPMYIDGQNCCCFKKGMAMNSAPKTAMFRIAY